MDSVVYGNGLVTHIEMYLIKLYHNPYQKCVKHCRTTERWSMFFMFFVCLQAKQNIKNIETSPFRCVILNNNIIYIG